MKNHNFYEFFIVFTIKPTFTIIFVISASKYVSIHSFKKNGGNGGFSELYPIILPIVELRDCLIISEFFNDFVIRLPVVSD